MTPADAERGRPRRWLVIGPGGAGKSALATELGDRLALPVIHLDRHYWRPGWVPTPRDDWNREVARLCSGDAWIMDGNYGGTLDVRLGYADAVVFLDFPRWLCLLRVIRRRLASLFLRPRRDLPEGVRDRLTWEFLVWIWQYPRRSRGKVLAQIARRGLPLHRLTTGRDVRRFLESVAEG